MVQFKTPPIIYHGGEGGKADPLLSIDLVNDIFYLPTKSSAESATNKERKFIGIIATGGGDGEVRLWSLPFPQKVERTAIKDNGKEEIPHREDQEHKKNEKSRSKAKSQPHCPPAQSTGHGFPEFHLGLEGHQSSVNCVRFSPDKRALAAASDGGTIIVWALAQDTEGWHQIKDQRSLVKRNLRNVQEDIYDLTWSPDGTSLVSVSIDGTAVVWDVKSGRSEICLEGHSHYVQGVSWDPLGRFLVTQSGDRTCRVYTVSGKGEECSKGKKKNTQQSGNRFSIKQKLKERPYNQSNEQQHRQHAAFLDETVPSFFRRLAWTPDGAFLITPCGQFKSKPDSKPTFVTYMFLRSKMDRPAMCLPGIMKPSVAVKCCPKLFSLKKSASPSNSLCSLPYRMVFAVLTLDQVLIYDTQHTSPIFVASGLHYAQLTDACWSADGCILIVSSQDGYLTLIYFDEEDLGEPLPEDQIPVVLKKKANTIQPTASGGKDGGSIIKKKMEKSHGQEIRRKLDDARTDEGGKPADCVSQKAEVVQILNVQKKKKITPQWLGAADVPGNKTYSKANSTKSQQQTCPKETSQHKDDLTDADIVENLGVMNKKKRARITPTLISAPETVSSKLECGLGTGDNKKDSEDAHTNQTVIKRPKRITPINISSSVNSC